MAPTEGRVAKPERPWGCCRGTPNMQTSILGTYIIYGDQGNVSLSLPAVHNSS